MSVATLSATTGIRMARPQQRSRAWPRWCAAPSRGVALLALACALWCTACAAGVGILWLYASTPGASGATPGDWPMDSALPPPAPGHATLVLALHPRCPCSRATLGELAQIAAHTRDRLRMCVLMIRPSGMPEGWERTDLWTAAQSVPGVTVLADPDGREAARFGAETSGAAALYDEHGRLVFTGGITASRGHAGDNAGRDAIIALALGQPTETRRADVYGCPLFCQRAETVTVATADSATGATTTDAGSGEARDASDH